MNIEKISDTQLKILCSAEEIRQKGLTIDDLSYGSEETGKLIRSALLNASVDHEFNTKDSNLMVEITPLPSDDLEILITKVDYPDEFDTRYAEFLQAPPETDPAQEEDGISDFRDDSSERENEVIFPENSSDQNTEEAPKADPSASDRSDSTESGTTSTKAAKESSSESGSEDYLPINDPDAEENESDQSDPSSTGLEAFQDMIKSLRNGEVPPWVSFAPIDPSQLANLPGFDPSALQNGQILGGTIIDARTSDGRVLSPNEISDLLKGMINGFENRGLEQSASEEDPDAELDASIRNEDSDKIKAKELQSTKKDIVAASDSEPPVSTGDGSVPSDTQNKKPLVRMFAFDTLDDCIQACASIADFFHGGSKLFRAPKSSDNRSRSPFGEYILCITNDRISGREFSMAYNQLFEYNGRRIPTKVSYSHIEEHYDLFIAADAVSLLKDL